MMATNLRHKPPCQNGIEPPEVPTFGGFVVLVNYSLRFAYDYYIILRRHFQVYGKNKELF